MVAISHHARTVGMAAAAAALALSTAGCSSSVPKADVETTIQTELGKQIPNIGAVTCPGDLEAKVGQTVRCEFVVAGQPVDAVATVTLVEGSRTNFDVKTEARPVSKTLLETKVAEAVGEQFGVTIDSTTCSGDLQPQIGQTADCTVTSGADSLDREVTVTGINGGLVNFSIGPA